MMIHGCSSFLASPGTFAEHTSGFQEASSFNAGMQGSIIDADSLTSTDADPDGRLSERA